MINDTAQLIRNRALWMRGRAFRMVHAAQLGHPGGDFSTIDIVATLYFGVLNYDPQNPTLPSRDRNYQPGVATNTGPLGHGFPVALGIAIAGITGQTYRAFVLTGDGELQEGSNWEAAMSAGHRKLENLTLIVDRNRLQQGAGTEETNALDPLDDRFRAFGFHVEITDGHDVPALLTLLSAPPKGRGKPLCFIANTIKGKGVSFIENQSAWHHGVPNAAQFAQAMQELV